MPVHQLTASIATVVSGGGRRRFPYTDHVAIAGMGLRLSGSLY